MPSLNKGWWITAKWWIGKGCWCGECRILCDITNRNRKENLGRNDNLTPRVMAILCYQSVMLLIFYPGAKENLEYCFSWPHFFSTSSLLNSAFLETRCFFSIGGCVFWSDFFYPIFIAPKHQLRTKGVTQVFRYVWFICYTQYCNFMIFKGGMELFRRCFFWPHFHCLIAPISFFLELTVNNESFVGWGNEYGRYNYCRRWKCIPSSA